MPTALDTNTIKGLMEQPALLAQASREEFHLEDTPEQQAVKNLMRSISTKYPEQLSKLRAPDVNKVGETTGIQKVKQIINPQIKWEPPYIYKPIGPSGPGEREPDDPGHGMGYRRLPDDFLHRIFGGIPWKERFLGSMRGNVASEMFANPYTVRFNVASISTKSEIFNTIKDADTQDILFHGKGVRNIKVPTTPLSGNFIFARDYTLRREEIARNVATTTDITTPKQVVSTKQNDTKELVGEHTKNIIGKATLPTDASKLDPKTTITISGNDSKNTTVTYTHPDTPLPEPTSSSTKAPDVSPTPTIHAGTGLIKPPSDYSNIISGKSSNSNTDSTPTPPVKPLPSPNNPVTPSPGGKQGNTKGKGSSITVSPSTASDIQGQLGMQNVIGKTLSTLKMNLLKVKEW